MHSGCKHTHGSLMFLCDVWAHVGVRRSGSCDSPGAGDFRRVERNPDRTKTAVKTEEAGLTRRKEPQSSWRACVVLQAGILETSDVKSSTGANVRAIFGVRCREGVRYRRAGVLNRKELQEVVLNKNALSPSVQRGGVMDPRILFGSMHLRWPDPMVACKPTCKNHLQAFYMERADSRDEPARGALTGAHAPIQREAKVSGR